MTVLHDDPYRVLGVARDADQAAIRRAYRALAKQYHPDMKPGDSAAESKFKDISLAYDILGDADKRARYDRGEIGPDGAARAGFGGGGFNPQDFAHKDSAHGGQGPFTFRWRTTSGGQPGDHPGTHPGGIGGEAFSDIFADLFGGAGHPGGFGAGPVKGADLRARLTLSFEEMALGTRKQIRPSGGGPALTVTIPAGLEDGHVLRLKGKGQPGPAGTPAGDLLIEIAIAPHPRFRRDGLDVHVDVSLPLADAVLGGKVTVPTPAGPVSLTVPPNSSSGQKMRLKGRGIHHGAQKGNLYARLMITLPDPPDPRLEAAIRTWAGRA